MKGQTHNKLLINKADSYIVEGNLDSASIIYTQLLEKAIIKKDTTREIKCLTSLSNIYIQKDSLKEAQSLLKRVEDLANYFYQTELNIDFANIYQYYGSLLIKTGNIPEAINSLNNSINIRQAVTSSNDTLLSFAYNKLGTCYWNKRLNDSSLFYYQKALELSLNKTNPENPESASYYQNVGFAYLNQNIFDEAEKYLLKSLKLKQKLLTEDDLRLARIYLNLGYFYFRISLSNKALKYYQLAEQVYMKNTSTSNDELARLYLNIGSHYMVLLDFNKSLVYLNKALSIYDENPEKNKDLLYRIYINKGWAYFLASNYEESVKNYLLSLSSNDENALIRSYRNLARSYEYLQDFNKSEEYFKKSIDKALQIEGGRSENLMLNYLHYANLLYKLSRKSKALDYYIKAYKICDKMHKQKSRDLSLILYSLGKYYFLERNYEEALSNLQNALIAGIPDFNDSSVLVNPSSDQISTDTQIFNILNYKAKSLLALHNRETDDIANLENSIETFKLALKVSDNIIKAVTSETSQLEFLHSVRNTWNSMLIATYQLYQISEDKKTQSTLFNIAEQSKASLLLGALKDMDAKSYGNIPPSMINETDNIKKDLSYYEKQAYEEQLKPSPDESKMRIINNEIFRLRTRYDSLVASFEKNYPAYYKLKYDDKTISVEVIQQALNNKQVLMEYALADSVLLTFIITKDDYSINAMNINNSFYENIDHFRKILLHDGTVNYDSNDYSKYIKSAHELYNVLLGPSKSIIQNKEVIIIPDGEIGYLSFDMLLSRKPDKQVINYRTLPYALKESVFSYSSSATILFTDFGKEKDKPYHKLIAFAPSYNDFDIKLPDDGKSRNTRQKLLPIPGVKDEVKNILDIYSGKMFLDEDATESKFKSLSEKYNILHLAMHTIINDINPLYSFMVFAEDDSDTTNDGYLNTYELFNMNFNGELAVLSACNTGTGKMERGEGIMSLARGFIYSGIPSIVMTLWTVEDQPSADLITRFYKYLAEGLPKAVAMNKAKMDYLNKAGPLESHPYFWAGYVNIGDISPLTVKPRNPFIHYWWAWLMIPVIIIFYFIRKRKNKIKLDTTKNGN